MPTVFTQYQGFDVLEVEPSFDDPQTHRARNLYRMDPGTGKVSITDRSGVPVNTRKNFRWVMDGRAEIQVYRDFIANRKGACVPFWVPTWRFDLPMASDLPIGNAGLTINSIGYTKYVFASNARRYVAFIMPDRTKFYRHITGSSDGGATESLGLDSTFAFIVPAATMVCFLTLARLADDKPRLRWHNNNLAETTLNFIELPQEAP